MYFDVLAPNPAELSPGVLEGGNTLFYYINMFFIAVILGYLIYDNFKPKS